MTGGNHHTAMRLEQPDRVLPQRSGQDAEIDQLELDTEIVTRGHEPASLRPGERAAGRTGVAGEHEFRAGCGVRLHTRHGVAVGVTEGESFVVPADVWSEPDLRTYPGVGLKPRGAAH